MTKVAFLNDTSLFSSHFGCQLVGQVFREQIKRTGLDLVFSLPKTFELSEYKKQLDEVDLVVINGEGSIHHGRNKHLVDVADKYPSVLLNCVFQENPIYPALRKFLFISARESYSQKAILDQGAECHRVPDAIFASSFVRAFPGANQTGDMGITDNVVKEYAYKIGPFKKKITGDFKAHNITPAQYLYKLHSYRRICAGRFHAAVISACRGIPFSTWESNSWKTQAMLEDMGVPHLHFSTREEAIQNCPETFDPKIGHFADQAKIGIENMFDQVAQIAREQC